MRAEEIARPARRRQAEASRRGCGWQTELGLAEPRRQAGRVLQAQGAGAGRRCRAAWPGAVGNSWNTTSAGSGRAGSVFFTAPYVLGDLVGVASLLRVFGKLGRMLPSARGYCWSQDSWAGVMSVHRAHPRVCCPRGRGPPAVRGCTSSGTHCPPTGEGPQCQGLQGHGVPAETLWRPQDLPGPSDLLASWGMMAAAAY